MRILIYLILFLLLSSPTQAIDLYYFVDEDGMKYFTNIAGEDRKKISLPLKKSFPSDPSYKNIESVIQTVSKSYSIDPNLVRAIIKTESNFNPNAVSHKGAMGLMQLMPTTANEMEVQNPFNPEENIYGGVRYLSYLLQLFRHNLPLALAAYNAGPGRVIKKKDVPLIEETKTYIQKVIRYYRSFNEEVYKVRNGEK